MMRKRISPTKRLNLFLARNGICHICEGKIDNKPWHLDHRIPLAMGGADDESNWFPAHVACHAVKTHRADIPQIAKAKRRERARMGIRKRSTFACSRDGKFKKKIDGSVVLR